jgi:serine/threonine protein kinase/tetratricopeptide (TPR) repeat protein
MLNFGADLLEDMPRRLGSYRILERIGEGGMGVVYLAEQDPPLVRLVAVKLARTAVPGNRALGRFESERQTLAVMNHPNIARVFDAGSAPDSRPYFVMEHVAGESITEFCDARRLGIEKRLELFVRVCDGVQHAHLNAVIHRDLKPSNILVTTEAGRPTPKIIDFGVAKALDGGPGPAGGLTQFGQIVGTPEYMSPEQAALDGRPVDTRTDIYSLGVVFYELLVGGRPFERNAEPGASFVDLCRRIQEEDPERPSARTARTSDFEAARRRGYVPQALVRRLRGDLDAIAIKALAKDPAARYATPSDMATDIEQFLQNRPISARVPGPLNRLRKVFRRHRTAAVIITALSATLVGLAVVGTVQAFRAQWASARAEAEAQVANQVREFLLRVINPPLQWVTVTDTPTREALLSLIREQFADQSELQSQLLLAAGNNQTRYGRELDVLTASRERLASLRGPDSPQVLAADDSLARTYMYQGRCHEAESLLFDVLDRRRRLVGSDHPDTWRTMVHLGEVYKASQKHDRAAPLFEDAIKGLEPRLGPDDRDVLSAKVLLSGSYLELRRYAETQALLEPAVDRIRHVFGELDFQTHVALYNLGVAQANSGDGEGAFRYLRESIDRGWNYPTSLARDPMLLSLHGDPRFDALERAGRLNERGSWDHWCFEAQSRLREGRLADAERLLRDLIAAIERVDRNGPGGRAVLPRFILAKCWIRRGRFDDADRLLLPTLSEARAKMNHAQERDTLKLLAQCDIGRGMRASALARIAAAGAWYGLLYENVEKYYNDAQSEALRGRYDEALRFLARASEMGFDDVEQLEHDLAFIRLRSRAEFKAIAKSARRRAL